MKYKIGDKIKIRTWDDMKNEYGLDLQNGYKIHNHSHGHSFTKTMEDDINKHFPDRVLIIEHIITWMGIECYLVQKINWYWDDYMIECLAKDYIEPEPINNRFEILDI